MSRTWAAATDAQLRHAAAGVCGFPLRIHEPSGKPCALIDGQHHEEYSWTPDSNRDQLARVFMAAAGMAGVCTTRSDESPWTVALRDPRAALIGLLDLLNWPMPEETKQ